MAVDPRYTAIFNETKTMLNRPDYRDGGILASIEKDLKEFLDTLPKNCDDMALLKSKWNRIRYVSARYARFMEMFAKTGVTSENPLYTTTVKASVEIILIAGKVKEWMEHCAAFQQIPGLGGIVKTNRILDSDCPDPSSAASDNSEDRAIRNKILRSQITNPCGLRSFDAIAGGQAYKQFFQDYMTSPFLIKQYGNETRGITGTLLFGPPGTGKTLMAEAVAQALESYGSVLFSISSSTIKGKYVGESEKSIQFLFEEARRMTNCGKRPVVIFIDEIDGLLDVKSGGDTIVSQINTEMSGLSNASNKGLIVIAATNFPETIRESVLSRFINKIYVGLPNVDDIREILANYLDSVGPARVDMDLNMEDGQIRRKSAYTLKLNDGDALDVISLALADKNYAPREIENVLSYLRGIIYAASSDFITEDVPAGGKPDIALAYVPEQLWLRDRTVYRHRVRTPDGKCSAKPIEETRDVLIPIGFPPQYTEFKADGTPAFYYGSSFGKLNNTRGKRVTLVKTTRVKMPDPTTAGGMTWQYTITQESENGVDFRNVKEPLSPERLLAMLGPVQIRPVHFEDAMNAIKPLPISNAPAMLKYALSPGRTLYKPYARDYDIKQLAKLASEQVAGAPPDTQANVNRLIDQVNGKIQHPGEKEFTLEGFMKDVQSRPVQNEPVEPIGAPPPAQATA